MENNELQKIWKSVDSEFHLKSKNELELLLTSKAKQTLNRFLAISTISGLTGLGVVIYIVMTALNNEDDIPFLIHNTILGMLVLWSITANYFIQKKLRLTQINQPLKNWLEEKVNFLSKLLNPRPKYLQYTIITILNLLIIISIQLNTSNLRYMEFIRSKASLTVLFVSILIGSFVSYVVIRNLSKFQNKSLEFLNDMYNRLCKEE